MVINRLKQLNLSISGGSTPVTPVTPVQNTPPTVDHFFDCKGCGRFAPFGRVADAREIYQCHLCGHQVRFPPC